MAGVNKSESKSEVKNSVFYQAMSVIPPGGEHKRCRKALESAEAGVNILNEYSCTPLILAVRENNIQCIEEMIKVGSDVKIGDFFGYTALMLAVKKDHAQGVNVLIEAGADVNEALKVAVNGDHPKYVDLLIKAGADVNARTNDWETALLAAVKKSNTNLEKVDDSHVETVYRLIRARTDVNPITNNFNTLGETALLAAFNMDPKCENHIKSHRVNVKIVKSLIKAGVDVNTTNTKGQTPLFYASDYRCMDMLLEAVADVNITDNDGNTALHFWLNRNVKNYNQCVKRLLRAGIHINRFTTPEKENCPEDTSKLQDYLPQYEEK